MRPMPGTLEEPGWEGPRRGLKGCWWGAGHSSVAGPGKGTALRAQADAQTNLQCWLRLPLLLWDRDWTALSPNPTPSPNNKKASERTRSRDSESLALLTGREAAVWGPES